MNASNLELLNIIELLAMDVNSIRKMAEYVKDTFADPKYEIVDYDDVVGDIEAILIDLNETTYLLESAVDDDIFGKELERLGCPCIGCPAEDDCDVEYTDRCVSWQQWFDNLEDISAGDTDE